LETKKEGGKGNDKKQSGGIAASQNTIEAVTATGNEAVGGKPNNKNKVVA
jgi:hypothetical protein